MATLQKNVQILFLDGGQRKILYKARPYKARSRNQDPALSVDRAVPGPFKDTFIIEFMNLRYPSKQFPYYSQRPPTFASLAGEDESSPLGLELVLVKL